jgi:ribosomal protein L2
MRTSTGLFDVIRLEYDPGRSAHIALVCNRDPTAEGTDKWAYILAPEGLKPGDTVQSFRSGIPSTLTEALGIKFSSETLKKLQDPNLSSDERSEHNLALGVFRAMTLKVGNVLPLRLIPPGTEVHNIAIDPKGRFKLVRSAGSVAMVVLHEKQGEGEYQRCPLYIHTFSLPLIPCLCIPYADKFLFLTGRYSHIRLQSGEIRRIMSDSFATIGKVSNSVHSSKQLGKAGSRWLGIRPTVRGVVMNAYVSPIFLCFFVVLHRCVFRYIPFPPFCLHHSLS